jgi:hypothetical protein
LQALALDCSVMSVDNSNWIIEGGKMKAVNRVPLECAPCFIQCLCPSHAQVMPLLLCSGVQSLTSHHFACFCFTSSKAQSNQESVVHNVVPVTCSRNFLKSIMRCILLSTNTLTAGQLLDKFWEFSLSFARCSHISGQVTSAELAAISLWRAIQTHSFNPASAKKCIPLQSALWVPCYY